MKFRNLIIVIILLCSILFLFLPLKSAVVFYKENTSEITAYLPLGKNDRFDIIFTHSIHLTDVTEKYHVTDDLTIMQDEIIFESFGIGMPSNAEEGETFEYKDGKYHIGNLKNEFDSMNIRNGKTVSEHRLRWEDSRTKEEKMVWFNDYFEPGAWYTVQANRLSIWDYLKGVKIDE
jgi:hypothetical protein